MIAGYKQQLSKKFEDEKKVGFNLFNRQDCSLFCRSDKDLPIGNILRDNHYGKDQNYSHGS
jgi:hypothetical protein